MNPQVKMELSNGKVIELELFRDVAPISVENFIKYAKDGFYEGTIFHRIIRGFMIQGGGFYIDGMTVKQKEPTYPPIKGEFQSNGVKNDIKHVTGVLSMARTGVKDSGTSQFFICSATSPHLDGEYAAFGRVTNKEGLDAVAEMEKCRTGSLGMYMHDFPVEPVSIVKVTISE